MRSVLLEGVVMVWESNRWDEALTGHAWYAGQYGVFQIVNFGRENDSPARYAFYAADTALATKLLAQRQLFEDLVGHHCTYNAEVYEFDPDKAISFASFYGRGVEKSKYVTACETSKDEEQAGLTYIGDFHRTSASKP